VHWDNGRFEIVVQYANANKGIFKVSLFATHRFFITVHGAREGLVDRDTNKQLYFVARHPTNDWDGGTGGSAVCRAKELVNVDHDCHCHLCHGEGQGRQGDDADQA
jgi:hypothetical protein